MLKELDSLYPVAYGKIVSLYIITLKVTKPTNGIEDVLHKGNSPITIYIARFCPSLLSYFMYGNFPHANVLSFYMDNVSILLL